MKNYHKSYPNWRVMANCHISSIMDNGYCPSITTSENRNGEPTKSGYLTFDPGGMSKINWRELYQQSESNKASIGETNKSTQAILEMPQDTCPTNF